MAIKFKDLPKKEQEGYVINYTNPVKVKVYLLCYHDTHDALMKLNEDDDTFFAIDAQISRYNGSERLEENIRAKSRDVLPVIEELINTGRYFRKEYDYQTISEMAENESSLLRILPEDFQTEAIVDHLIENNRYVHVSEIPEKYMTAERFLKLYEKDYAAENYLHKYIHLLNDKELLQIMCHPNSTGLLRHIPEERWSKELMYDYLEYCVHNNKETGFSDFMIRVPEELKDRVYYQCCCMIGGFYYCKIPDSLKESVISKRLIAETIKRWDIHMSHGGSLNYNGLGWMLQYLPESFINEELCIEVCKRYPYAISHVPDDIVSSKTFWKETLSNDIFTPLLDLDSKKISLLPKEYAGQRMHLLKEKSDLEGNVTGKTEEEWKEILSTHGAKIYDMPKKYLSIEMLLTAMKSNAYALEKNLSILDDLSDEDKDTFWKTVVSESLFRNPISVPDQYMTNEAVRAWAEEPYSYDVAKISNAFQTEDILITLAKLHPDRFTFPMASQTQKLIDTIISLQEKDICKALILKKVRPDLRRKELVDELCLTVPREMISLNTISKEQIDRIVERIPNLIVYAPLWYILDLREEKENGNAIKETAALPNEETAEKEAEAKPTAVPAINETANVPLKELISSESFTQLSIFDFLAS